MDDFEICFPDMLDGPCVQCRTPLSGIIIIIIDPGLLLLYKLIITLYSLIIALYSLLIALYSLIIALYILIIALLLPYIAQ